MAEPGRLFAAYIINDLKTANDPYTTFVAISYKWSKLKTP